MSTEAILMEGMRHLDESRRLAPMMLVSALIGAVSSVVGLYISYYFNIVSGSSVVLTATAIFMQAFLWKRVRAKG